MEGIRLGSVLGFEVRADASWFVIVALIVWSLSAGVFPASVPGADTWVYLAMGWVGAALFFGSLLAHELAHAVVARRRGIVVSGITLFVFGGMARTAKEAERPEDEFAIAGAGPLASVLIGLGFSVLAWGGRAVSGPPPVVELARYLGFLNLVLALFNLLPGFPLDGGRLLRAAVWRVSGDLTRATRWATNGGKVIAFALMGVGVAEIVSGLLVSGLWLLFIGWFLRGAAVTSMTQHLIRGMLDRVRASEVMTRTPSTVEPALSIRALVDDRLLHEPYQSYPVVDAEEVVGLVTLDHVRRTPREAWGDTRVSEVMDRAEGRVVSAELSLARVLEAMSATGSNRVMVVEGGRLVGVISASDVARWVRKEQLLSEVASTG